MGFDTWEVINDGTTYDYPCDCFNPQPASCTRAPPWLASTAHSPARRARVQASVATNPMAFSVLACRKPSRTGRIRCGRGHACSATRPTAPGTARRHPRCLTRASSWRPTARRLCLKPSLRKRTRTSQCTSSFRSARCMCRTWPARSCAPTALSFLRPTRFASRAAHFRSPASSLTISAPCRLWTRLCASLFAFHIYVLKWPG